MILPRVLPLVLALLVGWPGACQPARADDPPTPADIAGLWQRVGGHDDILLTLRKDGNIAALGKTAGAWRGGATAASDASPGALNITLQKNPTAAQMNPDIVDWAREQAAGKLTWRLTLTATRTPSSLLMDGQWDRGEVTWKEADTASASPARSITIGSDAHPIHVQYRKAPCVAEDKAAQIEARGAAATLATSADVAERMKADKSSPGHGAFWFAELYYLITKDETNSANVFDHPGFLLHFIPIFYGMYQVNADRFIAGNFDQIAPNWRDHFGELPQGKTLATEAELAKLVDPSLADRVREAGAASAMMTLGIEAHIKGDMAAALAVAYRSYAAKYCKVPPFATLHNDFFDRNRAVFEQVIKDMIAEFGEMYQLAPNSEVMKEGQKFLEIGLDTDMVWPWRQAAWDKAAAGLGQD